MLESELEDDLCTEDHTSMDDSSFLPSFSKKPSPFATSKTMFETSETGKVCSCCCCCYCGVKYLCMLMGYCNQINYMHAYYTRDEGNENS